ncbi:NAD-dependent epimerase/dehydratase family protein [Stakelama saccharophila]|uniref:GDP-mannose 4,6-dehydratase n=1 Tax=Stakelama saccharophila TaxID=3075605 RepID=A0ABZ0B8D1_9SPHN|nr:NAD-dependent epimerase/dehydratase family protein [Stakelama sp. W311]WNO52856.1 GDP-mannose 4,6-dehydratase [Stakelama sp. W311]
MKKHNGETALVAGGAGFIGSHLCRALLQQGYRVVCLDNLLTSRRSNLLALEAERDFTFVEGDVLDPLPQELCDRAGDITRIYNLACAASPPLYQADPEHTMLTNVVGTDKLLRFAEQTGARFLLTSTSEVYGDPERHPQVEDYRGYVSCTGPRACYDEGKRAAEAMTLDFARVGRADVRVARIFNTYGPNMNPDDGRVVSNLVCQALLRLPLTLYGDGRQTRSFCYVADMVQALMLLMESEAAGPDPINLGNPEELTITELVAAIEAIMPHPLEIIYKPLPVDDPTRRQPDISRARAVLGWHPETALSEGLAKTVAWFQRELGRNVPAKETRRVARVAAV